MDQLPTTGFVRLAQIVGDQQQNPPILPIIPISKSAWWNGVKSGQYPPSVKLSERTTVWRVSDIRQLIETGRWEPEVTEGAA